jgi:hypothetical protein
MGFIRQIPARQYHVKNTQGLRKPLGGMDIAEIW